MNEPSSIADRVGREAGGLLSVSARSERSRLCIFLSYFLLGLKRRSWVWTTAYTCRADDLEWHTFNLSTKRAVENLQRGGWRGIERRQMGDRAGLNNLMGVCQLEMPPTRRERKRRRRKKNLVMSNKWALRCMKRRVGRRRRSLEGGATVNIPRV